MELMLRRKRHDYLLIALTCSALALIALLCMGAWTPSRGPFYLLDEKAPYWLDRECPCRMNTRWIFWDENRNEIYCGPGGQLLGCPCPNTFLEVTLNDDSA